MKKSMILAAVAAIVLSACAKIETEKPVVDEPINFAAYTILSSIGLTRLQTEIPTVRQFLQPLFRLTRFHSLPMLRMCL